VGATGCCGIAELHTHKFKRQRLQPVLSEGYLRCKKKKHTPKDVSEGYLRCRTKKKVLQLNSYREKSTGHCFEKKKEKKRKAAKQLTNPRA
jgi:hypothetical protein